ncbi:unnamed protein product [Rotaria sordida]|uniref:Uncharacterized protein n=1 Tax=Rotaria sordida TaxID=392033 RepID=A0A813TBG5_9BILA|nr:unnamed protein product [Rotaria sordida]CAF3521212.1 unnamed protein product [Rotaria sordida]CAF3623711.1 unnamed protein product [Rotaria sordida]
MALLEDPIIQRILDEVNKAATGGVLGMAGNYISKPTESITPFESQLLSSENNFFNQDQISLFYPTSDMFGIDELTDFDQNIDLNSMPSMVSMTKSSNFDYYSTGLYNTMPKSFLSPFENYNDMTKIDPKHQISYNKSTHGTSNVSSTNNDMLLENRHQQQQQEYHTSPLPSIATNVPNLGLNIRTTPQLDPLSIDTGNSNEIPLTSEQISNEIKNISTMNLINDKEDTNSLPLNNNNNNNDIDQDNSNSPGKIFYDPNPQIIQRKGSHSVTYKQNIIVRFLQPPPIPNAGPLIIKEVRAPQPSPLPPLVIKQRPTPPKTPPPLIIREKPPPLPSTFATKVITRQLPPEQAPPRAVIIERLPPLPPKPRDIIIERWLPYEVVNQKRKVIVQRAPKASKEHPSPKNVIITYEPVHAKIVRNFQKQNITREDPQAYLKRYGSQLYDPNLVIQQARAVGVIEDLNPPGSFISTITNNATTSTDFEIQTTNEHQQELNNIEHNEQIEENIKPIEQEQEEEIFQASTLSPIHIDENGQEEDVLVEENVTPFYMTTDENLQQTLHRLGIDFLQNTKLENHF